MSNRDPYHFKANSLLLSMHDKGVQPGATGRSRSEGDFAVVDFESDLAGWLEALKECHVAKPSRFTGDLLHNFKLYRNLPTPRVLAAVNKMRVERGLPPHACRTSDPERRQRRASTHRQRELDNYQAVVDARPLKPPGRT